MQERTLRAFSGFQFFWPRLQAAKRLRWRPKQTISIKNIRSCRGCIMGIVSVWPSKLFAWTAKIWNEKITIRGHLTFISHCSISGFSINPPPGCPYVLSRGGDRQIAQRQSFAFWDLISNLIESTSTHCTVTWSLASWSRHTFFCTTCNRKLRRSPPTHICSSMSINYVKRFMESRMVMWQTQMNVTYIRLRQAPFSAKW